MGAGRPKIEIDYKTVDKLLALQCTGEEIAHFLDMSYDTLERGVKETFNINFAEYSNQKRAKGKVSLRRMQWATAESGNVTMQIWLGKNLLAQTDKQEINHTGSTEMRVTVDDLDD